MTGERQPNVPVTATAFASYNEAAAMRPLPDPRIGSGSTDLPLPNAIETVEFELLLDSGRDAANESASFTSVLARRRSIREYGPLSATALVRVLDQVFKLQAFADSDDNAVRRFRPIPSAGARHPIVPLVLIDNVAELTSGLWRLDTDGRRLLLVETDPMALNPAWAKLINAGQFSQRPPAAVVLGAQFDATLARYPDGVALVWRDAGVALGALHLTASADGLGSCILGTAGVLNESQLAACGMVGTLAGDVGSVTVGGPTITPTATPRVHSGGFSNK